MNKSYLYVLSIISVPIRLGYILTSLYRLGIYGPAFSTLNLVPDLDLDLDLDPIP